MPEEELTLILRLRDEATAAMGNVRNQVIAAGAAIGAAGFKAGAEWDTATKTIVEGTGATGEALAGLQADYQEVARYGGNAATAIADLNTHLGLSGTEMTTVAAAALKMKVDTNLAGDVMSPVGARRRWCGRVPRRSTGGRSSDRRLGRSVAQHHRQEQRAVAGRRRRRGRVDSAGCPSRRTSSGPPACAGRCLKSCARWTRASSPAFQSLSEQLGDTTGAVESTYLAGRTWRDTLRETKDAAIAYIGPAGDMLGAIGSTVSALALAGPQILKWIGGINAGEDWRRRR